MAAPPPDLILTRPPTSFSTALRPLALAHPRHAPSCPSFLSSPALSNHAKHPPLLLLCSFSHSLDCPDSGLQLSNLNGILPEEIGDWVDLQTLEIWENELRGSVPASAKKWSGLGVFYVHLNHLSPAALPQFDFSLRGVTECTLFDHAAGGSNAFLCPWPPGAKAVCKLFDGANYVAITDSDCIAPNGCSGNSTKLPAAQCAAWQAFYDGTDGDHWNDNAAGCTRNDPCSCAGYKGSYPVCDAGGMAVVQM